jgi:uncharacterized cupin superfamily protein
MKKRKGALVRAGERPEPWQYSHPLNPQSEVHGQSLSSPCGMERIGIHLVRIPPGKESFIYHAHQAEEEFYFVVSGKGIAEIDGEEHEIGPGDFLGFGAPSLGHHLRNPFDGDLVYLVGGERKSLEIAEFPHLGKQVIRIGGEAHVVDQRHLQPFWKAVKKKD